VLSYFLAPFVDCSKHWLKIVVLVVMKWITPGECQGQIVELSFCADGDYIYRRTLDRSDNSVEYERRDWDFSPDGDGVDGEHFQPWNRKPGGEGWEDCEDPAHRGDYHDD
jgi:hypothetical protein